MLYINYFALDSTGVVYNFSTKKGISILLAVRTPQYQFVEIAANKQPFPNESSNSNFSQLSFLFFGANTEWSQYQFVEIAANKQPFPNQSRNNFSQLNFPFFGANTEWSPSFPRYIRYKTKIKSKNNQCDGKLTSTNCKTYSIDARNSLFTIFYCILLSDVVCKEEIFSVFSFLCSKCKKVLVSWNLSLRYDTVNSIFCCINKAKQQHQKKINSKLQQITDHIHQIKSECLPKWYILAILTAEEVADRSLL